MNWVDVLEILGKNVSPYALLVLLAIVCSLGIFLRGVPYGTDSYASFSCIYGIECASLGNQSFFVFLAENLPHSLLFWEGVQTLLIFLALVPIFLFVSRYFNEKTSLIATFLVVGLSPIFIFRFAELENDLFGLVMIFWALYLITGKKNREKVLAFVLMFASLGFWIGGLIYFPIFALLWWIFIPITVFGGYFYFWPAINTLKGGSGVAEQILLGGVFELFGLILITPFIAKIENKFLAMSGIFVLFLAVISPVMMPLIIPLMALACAYFYEFVKAKNEFVSAAIVSVAGFCLVAFAIALLFQLPSQTDFDMIHETLQIAQDKNISYYADFTYDYQIEVETHKPLPYQRQLVYKDWNTYPRPYVALTQDITIADSPGCNLIDSKDGITLKTIYLCD